MEPRARDNGPRPRLLFFRDPYPDVLPHHQQGHVDSIARGLEAFFDLTVVSDDCDFQEVVDRERPDLVLFDGGGEIGRGHPQRVRNVDTHCTIPRAGLVGIDGQSCARRQVLDRLDRYGAETIFTYNTGFGAAWPAVADRLIYWPWFVDDEIFRDYGLPKDIPVAMMGAGFDGFGGYPWRKSVAPLVLARFPSFVATRPRRGVPVAIHGEAYARMLNRSHVALGCGGSPRILVRKLLEIPACRSLLVTEATETARAMGFEDGVNCVFADGSNIVEALDDLFRNPERLRWIAAEGHRFAHAQHTARNRRQILEWLELRRQLKPGDRIVQPSLTEPLQIVGPRVVATSTVHLGRDGHIVELRRQALEHLWSGDFQGAMAPCQQLLHHYSYLNEAHLGMAVAWLGQGRPGRALASLGRLLQQSAHAPDESDPVERAYLLITLLALGQSRRAMDLAAREVAAHPALNAALALVDSSADREIAPVPRRPVTSIYTVPCETEGDWRHHFAALLKSRGPQRTGTRTRVPLHARPNGLPLTALFGVGPTAASFRAAHEDEFGWTVYLDNNAAIAGTRVDGLPVELPEDLDPGAVDRIVVCAASHPQILSQLTWLGVPTDKIWLLDRPSERLVPADSILEDRGGSAEAPALVGAAR